MTLQESFAELKAALEKRAAEIDQRHEVLVRLTEDLQALLAHEEAENERLKAALLDVGMVLDDSSDSDTQEDLNIAIKNALAIIKVSLLVTKYRMDGQS